MVQTDFREKRQYRRLDLRLPLEYYKTDMGRPGVARTMTVNVSTGGVYFETTCEDIKTGDSLALEVGVPPGDARFPMHGKFATTGKVVRTEKIHNPATQNQPAFTSLGVASKFQEGFKLTL